MRARSDADLRALIEAAPAAAMRLHPRPWNEPLQGELLGAVRAFDAEQLTRRLLAEWARLGPLHFLTVCVVPVVRAVGAAWADGVLEVRHEHFLSERVGDLVSALRLPYEERTTGPLVILTSLPGRVALARPAHGGAGPRDEPVPRARPRPETPPPELATLARDLRVRAVGISVSAATSGSATVRRLRALRSLLPRRTMLLVGGEGAPEVGHGFTRMGSLAELDAWARQAAVSAA